jgi:hypothetical protein
LAKRNRRHISCATIGAGNNKSVSGKAHCQGRAMYAMIEYIIIIIGHSTRFTKKPKGSKPPKRKMHVITKLLIVIFYF